MKLITQRNLIKEVAQRWKQHYYCNNKNEWAQYSGMNNTKNVYDSLVKLDFNTCSVNEVNKIVGNNMWTEITCDECEKKVSAVVQVGEEENHDTRTANLCFKCLDKAAKLKNKGNQK
jgi:hypothetical protein